MENLRDRAREALSRHETLVALTVFLTISVTGILVLARLIKIDLFHRTDAWRPFDVHPAAMTFGFTSFFLCLIALSRSGGMRRYRTLSIAALSAIALVSAGICMAATFPGAGSVAIRDIVSPETPINSPTPFGYAVLFSNGSPTLDKSEIAQLRRQILIFKECSSTSIELRGFASSAAYKNDSDNRNFELANKRAMEVKRILGDQGLNADVHIWYNYDQMRAARRVVDVDTNNGRVLGEETRNRRVELLWHGSPCASI